MTGGRVIDLSIPIYDGSPAFPGDSECLLADHNTIAQDGFNTTRITLSSHHGTHLDAPLHFLDGGKSLDDMDLSKCVGPALLVDLSHKGPKESIDVADLDPVAARIGLGSRVILRTGWDKVYPEPRYFTDFPYMTEALAEWLAARRIALVGMDMPTPNANSLEAVTSVHQILLRQEIVIVEWLAQLEQIPADEFYFIAAPLKLQGRDGSPVRALGLVG